MAGGAPPLWRVQWKLLVAVALLAVLLAVIARSLQLRITWYLAVDQFGYLTFAKDLVAGKLFHDWAPLRALKDHIPHPTDTLAQTYVWDGVRLYCRYAIGFPLMLAAWLAAFGADRAHYLNPLLFLVALVVLFTMQLRIFRSPWRALLGVVLIPLSPLSWVQLWALTLTRDMAGHLVGFAGLLALLPVRRGVFPGTGAALVSGLALGFAASIRPEGPIYLLPAAGIVFVQLSHPAAWRGLRRLLLTAGIAYAIGAAPNLAYNFAVHGNPFSPTQGMELQNLLGAVGDWLSPSAWAAGWHGGTYTQVQGGGLRLSHLPRTLPGNWNILSNAYGGLVLGAALWGVLLSAWQRRLLFVTAVPYSVAALLFYSCWARADYRYLIGVDFMIPMLAVEGLLGTFDLCRELGRRRVDPRILAGLALVAVFAGWSRGPWDERRPMPAGPTITASVVALGLVGVVLAPRRRVVGVVAPLLAVSLWSYCTYTTFEGLRRNASFQGEESRRSRATLRGAVSPNAVIVTTEDVGRPFENIEYYGGLSAIYTTDLKRWNLHPSRMVSALLAAGLRPYFLLPPTGELDQIKAQLPASITLTEVAVIPPNRAMDYFVAAPFHRGVPLRLVRASFPALEAALRLRGASIP